MKILQTTKYYLPSTGGVESVVKSIVEGVSQKSETCKFTVYSNNHIPTMRRSVLQSAVVHNIKEMTPFIYKSQPLSIRYQLLRSLMMDSDIIHHHYPFPNMELALLRNMDVLKTKRLVITWHANIKTTRWSWISKYYDPIIKRLLEKAERIIVTSPQLLEASNLLKAYEHKVQVIPLTFSPKICSVSAPAKRLVSERPFRVLFVGKLRAYKGLEYLIKAVANLDVELTIVGEGETEQELANLVTALELTSKVTFRKGVSDDELAGIYQSSDLFVLPSISEAEAFGVVQLEAMANGLPVINTRLDSGVPHVSIDGLTGLTVEPRDAEQLAAAIVRIKDNPELYAEFSTNALTRVKLFTTEKMTAAYLEIYEKSKKIN